MLLFPVLTLLAVAPLMAKEGKTMTEMKLTSPAFVNTKSIPGAYTCDGGDLSPPLAVSGVPKEAKSLALIMDDPDAPAGVWVHWVLWNIDPGTSRIEQGSTPAGARQGLNSWQSPGYRGPCPPAGTHRYYFRLYALKQRLELPASASRKDLERAMQGKLLASCELLGRYSRK
jgi:Raf kinase inhibitor-like YbhB/YbcL family protein